MSKERAAYQDYTIRGKLLPMPASVACITPHDGRLRQRGKRGLVFLQHMSPHWVPRCKLNIRNDKRQAAPGRAVAMPHLRWLRRYRSAHTTAHKM